MVSPGEDLVKAKASRREGPADGPRAATGAGPAKGPTPYGKYPKTKCLKRSLAKQQARDCRKRSCKRAMALRQGLVIR